MEPVFVGDVTARAFTYGCGMTTNTPSSSATGPGTARAGAATRSLPGTLVREIGLVAAGAVALTLIGQVALPLPFTPVPVTLGTLAALGIGGLLGARRALGSVSLYGAAAALGAPVLAGRSSGVGASFGYVLGYALAGVVAARALARGADGSRRPLVVRVGLMLLASALVYIPGLAWLKVATGAAWGTVFAVGLAPFVIGDALKSAVAALLPSRPSPL